MRFLIKIVFGVVLLAVLGVAAIAFLVPTDVVRDQAVAIVKEQTGRDLTVGGETSFAFYPNIGISLGDVALSSPPGMGGGPMVRMASLNLDLKLLPLLGRSVEVERLVLVRPVFDLRVDAQGRANWSFDRLAARLGPKPTELAFPAPRSIWSWLGPSPAYAQSMMQDLRLGEARIEDGLIQFTDERSGARHRFEAVNVALAMPQLSAPLDAEGSLVWRGEAVEFQGRLASPQALLRNEASPLSVTVGSQPLTGAFEGNLALADAMVLDGDLKAQSPSARSLLHWLGAPAPRSGFGPAALGGRLKTGAQAISFSNARFSLDGMSGQGNVSVQLAGARPMIRAALSVDMLDLNAFGDGFEAGPASRDRAAPSDRAAPERQAPVQDIPVQRAPAPGPQAAPAPAQGPTDGPKPNQSLTDFIEQLNRSEKGDKLPTAPAPAVRAWNDRAFDFAALKAVDADVTIASGQILYKAIKTGRSALAATVKNGVLTADLTDLSLYGGTGSGRLTLNGAQPVPALTVRLDLDGVSALPLLKDAMAFDWIDGKAKVSVSLSGAGQSQSELVRALQGNGSVVFSDGALVGINIPEMARGLKSGRLDGWRRDERQKTDFSRLSGTFTMQNGVARNSDLAMIGPLVRVSGSGSVDLPREWIDFSLLPRVVASLEGQGGQSDLTGIPVPLKLEGPLDRPQVRPDLEQLMNNPDLANEAINKIGEAVKNLKQGDGKQVEQLLQNFLGGGQAAQDGGGAQAGAAEEEPQQKARPEDLLKNFFRR